MRTRFRSGLGAALVLMLTAGCGSDGSESSANYGNILNSPAGLVLVEEEHQAGWGRAECFSCHEVRNMHTENRTGLPDCPAVSPPPATPAPGCIDLASIQQTIQQQGQQSCTQCHGPNGVPTPVPTPTPVES